MVVEVGLIALSVLWSAFLLTWRGPGYGSYIGANAIVVIGGVFALEYAQNWSGWLTAGLFMSLVGLPLAFSRRAQLAGEREQWDRAAKFRTLAHFFHPSARAHSLLALARVLRARKQRDREEALKQLDARSSLAERAFVHLFVAVEERDWANVLERARSQDLNPLEAKPFEIRALGELGRVQEMVQAYETAPKPRPRMNPWESLLYLLVFTGRVAHTERLLNSGLLKTDDDSKTYWVAVARIRCNPKNEEARASLRRLGDTAATARTRRSAVRHLQSIDREGRAVPPLSEALQRVIDIANQELEERLRSKQRNEEREQERRVRRRHRRRVALWLLLICVLFGVIEGIYTFHSVRGR